MNENTIRSTVINSMRAEIKTESWHENHNWVTRVKKQFHSHALGRHDMIKSLPQGVFQKPELQQIHLDYRHAIVQIFTDALLMAQFQTRQLEPRLRPGAKMSPRFLLTLNILDEFGFQPGAHPKGGYMGNAKHAHYELYEELLTHLSIGNSERETFNYSMISRKVREYLEASFTDYISILALLAVAEEQVILFSPPLREAVAHIGIDVTKGYYYVHGTSSDEDAAAADDDHEDDLWLALTQAVRPEDYERVEQSIQGYADLWVEFWDYQAARLNMPVAEAAS